MYVRKFCAIQRSLKILKILREPIKLKSKKLLKKDQTDLDFGLVEIASIVTIISNAILIGKELANIIHRWLEDNKNQKIVVRTMVATVEITSDRNKDEIIKALKKAGGIQ
ncbi:hypothetical protein D3OALGB2SA_303 [Olavius algarvensis associated proteobacterium Delta 3]|nr:hypothetical protein D3OALGB2SA_303 [Olavius algarvensis associated proteobacterium Delta 3]